MLRGKKRLDGGVAYLLRCYCSTVDEDGVKLVEERFELKCIADMPVWIDDKEQRRIWGMLDA